MADTIKVAELLPERIEGLGTAARDALCNDAKAAGLQVAWDYVSSRLDGALRQALDCDLFDVLARGWAQSPLLTNYVAALTQPAAEVHFGKHELTRELKPSVAVTIAGCPCIELEFTFAIAAQFSGLTLDIADRHITGGSPGAVSASAELSLGEVTPHQAQSRELELPRRFRFTEPGIPIAPAA